MQTSFLPSDPDPYIPQRENAENALKVFKDSVQAFYHPTPSATLHNIDQISTGGHSSLQFLEEAARHAHTYISHLEKNFPQFNYPSNASNAVLRASFKKNLPEALAHLFKI